MKTAVITGATHGIGKAVAETLLKEGFAVFICARNMAELQSLAGAWQKDFPGAGVFIKQADFSQPDEVAAFAGAVHRRFRQIDILVNNAGVFEPGNIADEPQGRLERMMQVNLYAAYQLTRFLLEQEMLAAGSHIFNMCSVASLKAYSNGGSYSITKYALLGFSENLREELKPTGIRVTALCPGATDSRSWSGSGIDASRIMEANDVATMLWAAYRLSAQAVVETIVMRPQLGDV